MEDLEGPGDADEVVRTDPGGGFWIYPSKPLVEGRRSLGVGTAAEGGPKLGVRRRGRGKPAEQGTDVKTRPSDDDGKPPSPSDLLDGFESVPAEACGMIRFRRVYDVNQVVRDRGSLFSGRFTRPDIHPPIDLTGISADNLHRDLPREKHSQGGLADPRGTDDREEWRTLREQLRIAQACARPGRILLLAAEVALDLSEGDAGDDGAAMGTEERAGGGRQILKELAHLLTL